MREVVNLVKENGDLVADEKIRVVGDHLREACDLVKVDDDSMKAVGALC